LPKTSDHHRLVLNPPSISARTAGALWFALSLFILYGSISDLDLQVQHAMAPPGFSAPDFIQNLLLYLPFGTLGVWALRQHGRSEGAMRMRVIGLAAACSTIIEWLQLYSASRITSPLDVLANVAGASAGAMSSRPVEHIVATVGEWLRPTGLFQAPARFALAIAFVLACAMAWYPFDITLDVSTLSDRTRAVRQDPWMQPQTSELLAQLARYFILAGILTASLPGLRRRAPLVAALLTTAAAIVIDLGQLAMGSQPIGLTALLAQAAGGCAGAAAGFVATAAGNAWYADA
jgi:VanZ family protein